MLITCPECGLQVSDKATACPHCGFPMKSQKVKRKYNKRRRLPNGFGQITELKNRNLKKPFRAMVSVGKSETTKRPICKLLKPQAYFETYNEAYEALLKYNKNPYDLDEKLTLETLYDRWLKDKIKSENPSESTIVNTKNSWRYADPIRNLDLLNVRTRHLRECCEDDTIPASVKVALKSTLTQMYDYAVQYELIDHNYARDFKLSKVVMEDFKDQKHHIDFTEEELKVMWSHSDNEIFRVVLIQCYSGWRPSEIVWLKRENVNLEEWWFEGGMKTKAGKSRRVPIHSKIRQLVTDQMKMSEELGSEYLIEFTSSREDNKNKKSKYANYRRGFNDLVSEYGLNSEHKLHDCRVTFTTKCKEYGVDEYALKRMVGHKIDDITERVYTQRKFDWLASEIEKIK